MMETHPRGVELFTRGQYQGAIGCFEACFQVSETSEVWNDWAAVKFASGRPQEAREGLKRALELDPQNTLAVENLRALNALNRRPAGLPAAGGEALAGRQEMEKQTLPRNCVGQQVQSGEQASLQELLRDIQIIPADNPNLLTAVLLANRILRFDSQYLVEKCLNRLCRHEACNSSTHSGNGPGVPPLPPQ